VSPQQKYPYEIHPQAVFDRRAVGDEGRHFLQKNRVFGVSPAETVLQEHLS